MKKILQVVSCLALGGTEAFIMNNYRQLNKAEYQFDFMVFLEDDYPYTSEIHSLGGKIFFCGLPSIQNLKKFEDKAVHIMKENGPYEVVHSHVNIQNGFVLKAAYKAGIKRRISHSHDTSGKGASGTRYLVECWKEYLIKKYATDFLACSNLAGIYLYGEKQFLQEGRMIPNGIKLTPFLQAGNKKDELYNEFEIPESCHLIVGNITRFEPKKNPLFVVNVFNKLLAYYPDAILLLGGPDGGQLEETKELANELNISNHVRFIGSRRDIPDCLNMIDVYLFPSIYEGLSIGFLEAQAAGCLCVASKGVSEEAAIVESSTLYLDLGNGTEFWADNIARRIDNWQRPNRQYIKKRFEEKSFDIETAHKKLIEVYDGEKR